MKFQSNGSIGTELKCLKYGQTRDYEKAWWMEDKVNTWLTGAQRAITAHYMDQETEKRCYKKQQNTWKSGVIKTMLSLDKEKNYGLETNVCGYDYTYVNIIELSCARLFKIEAEKNRIMIQ